MIRLIRSLLFAPANRPELIRKFPKYAADAVAIDLEDGTPENQKAAAREHLREIVADLKQQRLKSMLLVRTNALRSPHIDADVAAVRGAQIDGLIVPKLELAADLQVFEPSTPIIGMIETARGVAHVELLAEQAKDRLVGLGFGAEDFITDVGGRRSPEGVEVFYARSRVVLAARLGGLPALDLVFTSIRDDDAFRRDAEFGRQLGYAGKMCITPRQVQIANEVFSPSSDEVERSRRLIQMYEAAEAEGRGVIEFEGGMVDEPVLKRARAVLQLADDPQNQSR